MCVDGRNAHVHRPDGTIAITLTQGQTTLVDAADWDAVKDLRWYASRVRTLFYPQAHVSGRKSPVRMHQFIFPATHPLMIDHVNGDGTDNRRRNLRVVTHTQNQQNMRPQRGTSSYKGVCWNSYSGKWQAYINASKRTQYLGRFTDEREAARAYDRAARALFGDHARLNFPEEGSDARTTS